MSAHLKARPKSFAAELEATRNKAAERKIRSAIAQLNDRLTDLFIERMSLDSEKRRPLYGAATRLEEHVFTLRMTLSLLKESGELQVGQAEEEALRAADASREAPKRSKATVAPPAAVEIRALPAKRVRGQRPATPEEPPRTIYRGGKQILLLGMGERGRGGEGSS